VTFSEAGGLAGARMPCGARCVRAYRGPGMSGRRRPAGQQPQDPSLKHPRDPVDHRPNRAVPFGNDQDVASAERINRLLELWPVLDVLRGGVLPKELGAAPCGAYSSTDQRSLSVARLEEALAAAISHVSHKDRRRRRRVRRPWPPATKPAAFSSCGNLRNFVARCS